MATNMEFPALEPGIILMLFFYIIKNTPGYNNFDAIDLIVCNTGKGGDDSFAKKLAEALKKPVKAPNCEIIVNSNGFYTLKDPNEKYIKYE